MSQNETPPGDLADFIVAAVKQQTSEDSLRQLVEKNIGQIVERAVTDSLRSYGDVGKQIEKAVTDALQIGDRIDVPRYGTMVMALLRAKMDELLQEQLNTRLAVEMEEILSVAPRELKLSTVVNKLTKDLAEQGRYGDHITCSIEDSEYVSGYRHIYIDPEENKRNHECEMQLAVTTQGKIYSFIADRKDAKTTIIMGSMYGWKKMLFAAYCSGAKLIVDEDAISTSIGEDF